MSCDLPAELDVWRVVAGRGRYSGELPMRRLPRLMEALDEVGPEEVGSCRYRLDFDSDPLVGPFVEVMVEATLPLSCRRSLERFTFPVTVRQRLGVLRDERDEAALPAGYEPLLIDPSGMVRPEALIEDELLLAIPTMPVKPDSAPATVDFSPSPEEIAGAHPFAVLAGLKRGDPEGR